MVVRRAEDLVETEMRGTDVAHALLVRDLFAAAVQQGMAFPPSAASWVEVEVQWTENKETR